MSFLKEFKEFAVKGNVVDMAVGVVIGSAFGKIVTSLVSDLVMPPIGLLIGGVDFSNLKIVLKEDPTGKSSVFLNYGAFLSTVIDFLVIALVIFIAIKGINKLKRPAEPPQPTTKECPRCFTSIPLKAVKCPNCTSDI